MGSGRDLKLAEKKEIVKLGLRGWSESKIASKIKRSRKAVSKVLQGKWSRKTRSDKGSLRKVDRHDLTKLKRAMASHPLASSREVFEAAGTPRMCRATRNRILNLIARRVKPSKQPRITKRHASGRMNWAEKYMKMNFEHVIFTDECRATLDGPDGWSRGWLRHGTPIPTRLRRQQGGGGVMFWAGIVGDTLVGPFKVPEGVKITSEAYIAFLKKHFVPWFKSQTLSFKRKAVLMQDGAPAHSAKATKTFLDKVGFKGERLMTWPSNSPDLNPIENLWAILKRRVYANGRQFDSKNELWDALQEVSKSITTEEIKNLVKSVDKRLFTVIKRNGNHINM